MCMKRSAPGGVHHHHRVPCRGYGERDSVGPEVLDHLAIAAFGTIGADGDQLEPLGTALEATDHRRGDTDSVPGADLDDLVAQPDPARAADDHVDLLLLAVTVSYGRSDAGAVPEVADPQVLARQVLAAEPGLAFDAASGESVLDFFQILDGEI